MKQLETFHGDTVSAYQGVLCFDGLDRSGPTNQKGVEPLRFAGLHLCEGFGGLQLSPRKLWAAAQSRMVDKMGFVLLTRNE